MTPTRFPCHPHRVRRVLSVAHKPSSRSRSRDVALLLCHSYLLLPADGPRRVQQVFSTARDPSSHPTPSLCYPPMVISPETPQRRRIVSSFATHDVFNMSSPSPDVSATFTTARRVLPYGSSSPKPSPSLLLLAHSAPFLALYATLEGSRGLRALEQCIHHTPDFTTLIRLRQYHRGSNAEAAGSPADMPKRRTPKSRAHVHSWTGEIKTRTCTSLSRDTKQTLRGTARNDPQVQVHLAM